MCEKLRATPNGGGAGMKAIAWAAGIAFRDAVTESGHPVALYVNLVTVVGPKAAKAKPRDRVVVRRRGGIAVTRFPPRVNG